MRIQSSFAHTALLALSLSALASAQNDECATAATLALGTTPFDTTSATLSAEVWGCAGTGGPDLWYAYTATSAADVRFETCGSAYDTALELFAGTCGALIPWDCNDDACDLQSSVLATGNAIGTVWYLRVGGFNGATGTGSITAREVLAPANDECTTATAIPLGVTAFDTGLATQSATLWACAGAGGPDVWFTYTATTDDDLVVQTCGSSFDTALEAFTGDCGALVSIACNDDLCGFQSRFVITGVTTGAVYTIRVGGFTGATGAGTLTLTEQTPVPPDCLETLFAANNGGAVGGAVYFDLTAQRNVSISGLELNTSATGPIGLEVYSIATTYQGNAGSMAGWTLVATDDGNAVGLGQDQRSVVTFAAPWILPQGTWGVALVGNNQASALQLDHVYTNGTGANQMAASPDGVLSLDAGAADNVPFAGGTFSPRVWNGRLCYDPASPGSSYCGPAVANSTGGPAAMGASGSANVASNDLVLEAGGLPANAFGYFLTSLNQGFTAMPGGSQGNLCLDAPIGRYVGAGQIQNSGALGAIQLAVDLTRHPQPTGFVPVAAGETWNFQAWYRDMDPATGMATSNFTDGLSVIFN